MSRQMGCCGGPRVSIPGLVAAADLYPATTPYGRRARARLVYTLAAGRAAKIGNQVAYQRAMAGLRGLGDEGGSTLTTHGTIVDPAVAAAQAEPISATLRSIINQAAPGSAATFRQASAYIEIVLGLVNVGTAIGGAAGGDANAIRTINMIVSWVRTLISGSAPTIPTLDAAAVQGLVGFCRFKDMIVGITDGAFSAGRAAALAASNQGGADALETLRVWISGILDGICRIPQIREALAAQTAAVTAADIAARDAACRASSPMSRYDAAAAKCVCVAGYRDRGSAAEGCYPIETAPAGGAAGPIMLSPEQRRAIIGGRVPSLTPQQQLLLRPILVTMTPGTLDPATLCAPGETANPCSGVCDGGVYAGMTCVNGVPTKSGGGFLVPAAVGAAALFFLLK